MWYSNSKEINKNEPIFAENEGRVEILLPQIPKKGDYRQTSYNWFNIKKGGVQQQCVLRYS